MSNKKENIDFLVELFVEVFVGIIAFLIVLIPAFLLNIYVAYVSNSLGVEDSMLLYIFRMVELFIVIADVILLVIFSLNKIKKTFVRLWL
jgi:hypothetical protein